MRWSAPGTKRCEMAGRSWPSLGETCYYPIDILHKPGVVPIVRRGSGPPEKAKIIVESFEYGTEDLDLGDLPQGNPSAGDLERNARDQALVAKVWRRKEGPPLFTLPLGPPATPLPEPKTFGWNRLFNGKPATQPHMGADYALTAGTPVLAAADGVVVLAEELFYPGNAVFIDHGDGLVTMSFHLSRIDVEPGRRSRRATGSVSWARPAAPPARTSTSACGGTRPESIRSSFWRIRRGFPRWSEAQRHLWRSSPSSGAVRGKKRSLSDANASGRHGAGRPHMRVERSSL